MDDLLAFLRAQLDEDERVARESVDQGGIGRRGEKHWHRLHSDRRAIIGDMSGNVVVHGIEETWSPSSYQAEHIARWDPARVLAEVEAKRDLLGHVEGLILYATSPDYAHGGIEAWANRAICLLAQPYAGRPGWREEWRA